jgi:Protein of unknown function (DUF2281)
MTAPNAPLLIIPESVLATLQALSPAQRQLVFDFAEFLVQKQNAVEQQLPKPAEAIKPPKKRKRIRDLDAGAVVWISDDFDEPLPDEFWFGENDPLMMTPEQIEQLNHPPQSL